MVIFNILWFVVKEETVSFLSKYMHILPFDILEMYLSLRLNYAIQLITHNPWCPSTDLKMMACSGTGSNFMALAYVLVDSEVPWFWGSDGGCVDFGRVGMCKTQGSHLTVSTLRILIYLRINLFTISQYYTLTTFYCTRSKIDG